MEYIYRIYYANDTLNCERYPVIYENKEYIYYKTARKSELSYARRNRCYKSLDEYKQGYVRYLDIMVFEAPKEDSLDEIKVRLEVAERHRRVERLKSQIERHKAEIEKIEKELEGVQ